MQTINHRPNLGIVGFGEKSTCQGVSKILISQLGEHLQNEFDIHNVLTIEIFLFFTTEIKRMGERHYFVSCATLSSYERIR